jgi:hypothetical protein
MQAIPRKGSELVDELDKQFPLRNPRPTQTRDEIMHKAGQRSVIEYLRMIQKKEMNR